MHEMEGAMKASEEMHTPVARVEADTSVTDRALRMAEMDFGAIPVGIWDRLVGPNAGRDPALRVQAGKRDQWTIRTDEVMSPGMARCRRMGENKVRRHRILNDKTQLVRMRTLRDDARGTSLQLAGKLARAVAGQPR
jgi:predicted transcriptional regulator